MRFRLGHVLFPDLAHWGGGVSGETGARDSRLKLPLLSLRTLSRRAWLRRRFSGEATARSDLSSFLSPPFAAAASPRREMQKRIANSPPLPPPTQPPPPSECRRFGPHWAHVVGSTTAAPGEFPAYIGRQHRKNEIRPMAPRKLLRAVPRWRNSGEIQNRRIWPARRKLVQRARIASSLEPSFGEAGGA